MRRFIGLIYFLACCSALMLQNAPDSAAQEKPVAAQTEDDPDSISKPTDSVLNVWQTTTDNSNVRTAFVTTNGKIPNGESQTMLQLKCRADSNDVASINYIVLDAINIKSFKFSDFEEPDAPAQLKKPVEFRATSPSGNLTFRALDSFQRSLL